MSIISNSFFVQVIEDGSQLRGEIRSTQPLSQAYSKVACVPNWDKTGITDAAKIAQIEAAQPIVYVILQNGASWVMVDGGYKWYYNEHELTFDASGLNTGIENVVAAGTFQRVTNFTPEMYQAGQYVPAIKIVKNLASSQNVDIDVIRFSGTKTLATNPVPFSASIDVSITEMLKGGYMGVIYLKPGFTDKDISTPNDTVGLIAHLYDSTGEEVTASGGVKYRWLINNAEQVAKGTTNELTVTEAMVYDYAVVACEFFVTQNGEDVLVSTDYIEIDDTQDPQEMYFAYNGANGKAASLRSGESVTFSIWVADAGNPDRTQNPADTKFSTWKVMLVDSLKQILRQDLSTAAYGSYAAADSDGYRTLTASNGVAAAVVPFALASLTADGQSTSGGIRGYVMAQTSNS